MGGGQAPVSEPTSGQAARPRSLSKACLLSLSTTTRRAMQRATTAMRQECLRMPVLNAHPSAWKTAAPSTIVLSFSSGSRISTRALCACLAAHPRRALRAMVTPEAPALSLTYQAPHRRDTVQHQDLLGSAHSTGIRLDSEVAQLLCSDLDENSRFCNADEAVAGLQRSRLCECAATHPQWMLVAPNNETR